MLQQGPAELGCLPGMGPWFGGSQCRAGVTPGQRISYAKLPSSAWGSSGCPPRCESQSAPHTPWALPLCCHAGIASGESWLGVGVEGTQTQLAVVGLGSSYSPLALSSPGLAKQMGQPRGGCEAWVLQGLPLLSSVR